MQVKAISRYYLHLLDWQKLRRLTKIKYYPGCRAKRIFLTASGSVKQQNYFRKQLGMSLESKPSVFTFCNSAILLLNINPRNSYTHANHKNIYSSTIIPVKDQKQPFIRPGYALVTNHPQILSFNTIKVYFQWTPNMRELVLLLKTIYGSRLLRSSSSTILTSRHQNERGRPRQGIWAFNCLSPQVMQLTSHLMVQHNLPYTRQSINIR